MNKPKVITLNTASLDGRVALGPNRTQWEELTDPRRESHPETGEVWEQVEAKLNELHDFGVKLQGSGSFVVDGQGSRHCPLIGEIPRPSGRIFFPKKQ